MPLLYATGHYSPLRCRRSRAARRGKRQSFSSTRIMGDRQHAYSPTPPWPWQVAARDPGGRGRDRGCLASDRPDRRAGRRISHLYRLPARQLRLHGSGQQLHLASSGRRDQPHRHRRRRSGRELGQHIRYRRRLGRSGRRVPGDPHQHPGRHVTEHLPRQRRFGHCRRREPEWHWRHRVLRHQREQRRRRRRRQHGSYRAVLTVQRSGHGRRRWRRRRREPGR